MNGDTSSKTDAIIASGCTYPVTMKTVTDNMKAEIKPLRKTLTIIEVSGKSLEGLGIVKMFLEADVLGGRKLAEASVTEEEGSKETLISLDLLKKWDLIDAYKQIVNTENINKMERLLQGETRPQQYNECSTGKTKTEKFRRKT